MEWRGAAALRRFWDWTHSHQLTGLLIAVATVVAFVAFGWLVPNAVTHKGFAFALLAFAFILWIVVIISLIGLGRQRNNRGSNLLTLLGAVLVLFILADAIADWTLSHVLLGGVLPPFATHYVIPRGCTFPHSNQTYGCESVYAGPLSVFRSFYLTLGTFTPAGAGDITAAHESGRVILMVQSILGFGILAIGLTLILPRIGGDADSDAGAASVACEIRKFSELRDDGVISTDEFLAAKTKLLQM